MSSRAGHAVTATNGWGWTVSSVFLTVHANPAARHKQVTVQCHLFMLNKTQMDQPSPAPTPVDSDVAMVDFVDMSASQYHQGLLNTSSLKSLMHTMVDALDNGPWEWDPQLTVMIAVATPLVLLAMCCTVMVCRGVPCTPCGGRCTYFKSTQVSVGCEPDQAIGEHQDEICDTDSIDEPVRVDVDPPLEEEDEIESSASEAQRECCNVVAAVLDAGNLEKAGEAEDGGCTPLNGHHASSPASTPGKKVMVTLSAKTKGKQAKCERVPTVDPDE